ncbi:MAG: phage holin family protein [Bacillota bacterium]|nr:phage holin family protein [Bacillota bacterium]
MIGLVSRLLINALALILMTMIVPGFQLTGLLTAIMAALVWGLVNTLVRPIFSVFTFPLQLLTLGLFTLVLNGCMLALTAKLVPGFSIVNFPSAFIGAIVLSIISLFLTHLLK